jgi:hypothetical protein
MGTGKNEGKGTSYQRIYLHDHDEQNFAVRQDSEKREFAITNQMLYLIWLHSLLIIFMLQ